MQLTPMHWLIGITIILLTGCAGDATPRPPVRTPERIEADIRRALPPVTVFTHLEPLGDPSAQDDQELHRNDAP